MFKNEAIAEQLETILEALKRIPRRFSNIDVATDFLDSDDGIDKLDGICMILIAIGEAFKQIDQKMGSDFLNCYPHIDWKGIKGVRDVIAHGYFDVDVEQVFNLGTMPNLFQIKQRFSRSTAHDSTSSNFVFKLSLLFKLLCQKPVLFSKMPPLNIACFQAASLSL